MVLYPGIARACLEIALDNGGIYRGRSVEQQQRELAQWLAHQPQELLPAIDQWLSSLSENDLGEFCCGGEDEPAKATLRAQAPPFTDDLLNRYFDEVC